MRRNLYNEFWKSFHNKLFWITLIIALGIVLTDVYSNYVMVNTFDEAWHNSERHGYQGIGLFTRWISVNMDTMGYAWFFFLFPLLAAFPFGWSYIDEQKSGYIKNIVTRSGKTNYYTAKYIAVFCSGGLVIAIPLFLDLMLNALTCPACLPIVTYMATPIWQGDMFSELFYTNPWIYSMITILVDFLWGGTISCVCLAISFFFRYKTAILLFPMICFVTIDYLIISFAPATEGKTYTISPLQLLHASTLDTNPAWIIFGMISVLIIFTFSVILFRGKKNEIL